MKWNFSNDKPIYSQIIEQIKLLIISGALSPGSRLPSVRDLAAEAGVNPNTMQRALAELERTGLIYSQRTTGKFITENTDIIELTKVHTADRKIKAFLADMSTLGYSKQEIAQLIKNYREEEINE